MRTQRDAGTWTAAACRAERLGVGEVERKKGEQGVALPTDRIKRIYSSERDHYHVATAGHQDG
jgi:hypothetical protein